MTVAAVRAEFAISVSAHVSQSDTAPATANGMANSVARRRVERAGSASRRREKNAGGGNQREHGTGVDGPVHEAGENECAENPEREQESVGVLVFPCVGGCQRHHGESRRDEDRQLNADCEPVPIKIAGRKDVAETDSAGANEKRRYSTH